MTDECHTEEGLQIGQSLSLFHLNSCRLELGAGLTLGCLGRSNGRSTAQVLGGSLGVVFVFRT